MAAEQVEEKSRRRRRATKVEEENTTAIEGKGKATPGRRDSKGGGGNFISRFFGGIVTYFREVRSEADKVAWPTREETLRLTRIVLITTIISSIVLGALSALAGQFIRFGLDAPIAIFAFMTIVTVGTFIYLRRSGPSRSGY